MQTRTPRSDGIVIDRSSVGRQVLVYALLMLFALIYIYPFVVQLVTSFKTDADAVDNPLSLVPDPFTPGAFSGSRHRLPDLVHQHRDRLAVVTAGRIFFCSLAGYALARLKFSGRGGCSPRSSR